MAWDEAVITQGPFFRPGQPAGAGLHVSWVSSAPVGTWYQLYANRKRLWSGQATFVTVPMPQVLTYFVVGAVLESERSTDFSGSLSVPPGAGNRITLQWYGGTYLDPEIEGYHVYGEATPGGGIDYGEQLAEIPAYADGIVRDGWGVGPWGRGKWGKDASKYLWVSGPLTPGTWHFGVKSFDKSGNHGTAEVFTATVSGPPGPITPYADGTFHSYTYDSVTRKATISWNPPTG